ncbi:MAG: metallophosphoesterase [Oscillospiraceae bacterium]|nr:metallophosphoesterase [Oscillospiraceae bacterium]
MIYITGDIHGDIDIHKLSNKRFPQQKKLTKKDYVIICGDFGLVWDNSSHDRHWIKWLEKKHFTTLFVDGNHENHVLLAKYPVEYLFGGKVHKISDSVYHLMRGQIFDIEGKRFFTMGGASSHDKWWRTQGVNWWPEEQPCENDYIEAVANLKAADWQVDYVITHCAPNEVHNVMMKGNYSDTLTSFFSQIYKKLKFKKWYCGHYHHDGVLRSARKLNMMYNNVVLLSERRSLIETVKNYLLGIKRLFRAAGK